MRIGVLKEIKRLEFRVGLVSSIVENLAREGHEVLVEAGAGLGVGIADGGVNGGGRTHRIGQRSVRARRLIVKVKEPQPEEIKRLAPHHILFTYPHLAADLALTRWA